MKEAYSVSIQRIVAASFPRIRAIVAPCFQPASAHQSSQYE